MKQCYYELLEVDRKATAAEIKTVSLWFNFRTIVSSLWSFTLIKIQLRMGSKNFYWLLKLMKFYQILMSVLGMITTARKYCLTRIRCQRKMFKCTALDSIFGHILLPPALKGSKIMKEDSIMSIVTYFKK